MTRREQLIALAEKVRALPGPDRDVDAEIAALCRLYFGNQDFVRDWSGEWRSINGLVHLLGKHGSCGNFSPEKFTGSIDAAQSISDAPCFFASDFGCDGIPTVMLCTTTETPPKHVKSEGRNLILAWCSAALMARAEEEG